MVEQDETVKTQSLTEVNIKKIKKKKKVMAQNSLNISPYKPNEIYCGDNAKLIKALPDNCIDLTVTSPPYDNLRDYKGYSWDFETLAKELFRVTKDGGVVVWVVNDQVTDGSESVTSCKQKIFFREECGFKIHDTMIYRRYPPPGEAMYRYYQEFEYMFVLVKNKIATFNPIIDRLTKTTEVHGYRTRRQKDGSFKKAKQTMPNKYLKRMNIWQISAGNCRSTKDKIAFKHPAIFPETLARDHIISWSNPGDIVLDPFMGSGTTAKMAKECQRHYLGFEISQEYITDIANERLRQNKLYGPKHITNSS